MRVPDTFVRHISEPLWDLYENSIRLATKKELEKSQWLDPKALLQLQNTRLKRICIHAAKTSSFYRKRFQEANIDPSEIACIEDLNNLPLLTKSDIRGNLDNILSDQYSKADLVAAKTGGSTGVALFIYCDQKGIEIRNAAALRSDEWSGWKLGQPIAAVWGNPILPTTLKNKIRAVWKNRIIYLDTMKIDDEAIDNFLASWKKNKPGMLYGHAHSIYIFAEALLARGITLQPDGIVATSMMLIDSEREIIEKACRTKVTNRYGCEEVSLISCECEEHNGMHLNAENNIVEFLTDDGSPCEPGQDGRIVVTELVNMGMPMIRYEVGDRGVPSDRQCPCGRNLPLMESLSGRTADFLHAQDGSRVAGISIIENSLTRFSGIRQLQIVQDEPLALHVNLVPGKDYSSEVADQLTAALREMLGATFSIKITEVASIAQESNGKYRFTICRL